MKALQ
jgi:hypothetical protein